MDYQQKAVQETTYHPIEALAQLTASFPDIIDDLELMNQIREMCNEGKDVEVRRDKDGGLAVYEISKSRVKRVTQTGRTKNRV